MKPHIPERAGSGGGGNDVLNDCLRVKEGPWVKVPALQAMTPVNKKDREMGGPSRWRRSETWRSPSSPQIYQKYVYIWKNSYRTPTERWQKTSDLPKGRKLPKYLDRAKEKRKNRDKRIGVGPATVGGSCEGGKVSTH